MIEAIYISDNSNTLVFEYLLKLSSPSFKSLISIVQSKLNEIEGEQEKIPLIRINNDYYTCFEKTRNLTIYVLVSSANIKVNPLIPYVFIKHLLEVMEDYFGAPLAVTKIEAHNDTLNLIANELIQEGLPNVTDSNRLRDIIPLKSLLLRLLSSTNELAERAIQSTNGGQSSSPSLGSTGSGMSSGMGSLNKYKGTSSTTDTPWRRTNVKYTNNEMFVDIVETINVILKPTKLKNLKAATLNSSATGGFDSAYYNGGHHHSGALSTASTKLLPVAGTIDGEINFTSHLTGVPELQLVLNVPSNIDLQVPSFHPCIKIDKWINNGVLSFVPADGKSTIMQYQVDVGTVKKTSYLDILGLVDVDFQTGLGLNENEFEIRLFIKQQQKAVTKIEDLVIKICTTNVQKSEGAISVRSTRCTHGEFSHKGNGNSEWNVRTVSTGTQPILRGVITSDENEDDVDSFGEQKKEVASDVKNLGKIFSPSYLKLLYSNKGHIPSGIKVDSLKIISTRGLGDTVKPYKGVKYITKTGEYVIRA